MAIQSINLEAKRHVPDVRRRFYRQLSDKRFGIVVRDRVIPLQSLDEPEHLDAAEKLEARAAIEKGDAFWDSANNTTTCGTTPDAVDHRPDQTPIRDQDDRGTCVCFASLAAVEVFLKAQGAAVQDLSEQFANWIYMQFEGHDWCRDGLKTTDSARYLSQKGVCAEPLCPYENRATVQTHCSGTPTPASQQEARYGIGTYSLIDRLGLNGPSIANTDYLECVLWRGHNIVFATNVAWGEPDPQTLVFDVILDRYGNPLAPLGGHAMLMVGYNRVAPEPYFICKNSWGTSEGANGYYYLSYDYVRQYLKYGYIVHDIRSDMA